MIAILYRVKAAIATDISQAAKAQQWLLYTGASSLDASGISPKTAKGGGNEKRQQNHHRLKNTVAFK